MFPLFITGGLIAAIFIYAISSKDGTESVDDLDLTIDYEPLPEPSPVQKVGKSKIHVDSFLEDIEVNPYTDYFDMTYGPDGSINDD